MIDKLVEIASQSGYTLELRKDSEQIWVEAANLFAKNQHISFDYTNENITYQLEYFVGNNFNVSDLSIIIEKDGTHKAIWPIALMKGSKNNITTLGQRGILPPIFANVSNREEKRLIRLCTEIIRTIVVEYGIDSWVMKDSFFGRDKISEWHRRLLSEGGKVQVFHELYLKLDKDYKKIREGYRDSYKSLINKGNRIWNIQVLDSDNTAIWQEFKELHKSVAGKQTRSDLSWDIQYDFIMEEKAFLVYILDYVGGVW